MIRKLICVVIVLLICGWWARADSSRYASNSVLAGGNWKKIKIEKTGIYKITYDELRKMGFPDPMKVSVHGYGGWPIDEDFTKPYTDDLPAVAVWRGESYLLFYGKGCCKWEYNEPEKRFVHTNNPYSKYGYYFLTDGQAIKYMELISSPENNPSLLVTDFDEYILHETDYVSVNKSGRDLFGESLSGLSKEIAVKGVDGMTDEEGKVVCRFIERTFNEKNISLFVDGELGGSGAAPIITYKDDFQEYIKAKSGCITGRWSGEKHQNIKVQIKSSTPMSNAAYVDYIYLQGKRVLKNYDEPYTFFRSLPSVDNTTKFIIRNADAKTLVFDVTDGANVKIVETKQEGNGLSFVIPAGALREFALVRTDRDFPSLSFEDVPAQNLHQLSQPDMVIISPQAFKKEAERLAAAHQEMDGFLVEVVSPEEIYNEFSSGTPDASAYRRFMKMFYDRSLAGLGMAPKYLLLFGDGAYDNRFVTKEWSNYPEKDRKNMLLTYQTQESLNAYSYVTDDYFGLLDDDEDVFHYEKKNGSDVPVSKSTVDIGIGRFPVRTQEQARQTVDKTIAYMSNDQFGLWKNSVCFLADDGNGSDDFSTLHQSDADKVAEIIEKSRPEYIVNKIYFDSYKKSSDGNPYPDVRKDLQRKLDDGLLVLDYVGHGGTEALSDDKVLTHNDILQSKYSILPFWITATCDFCRFDDAMTSAGEDVFLSEKSGGIGLLTTTRVAFTNSNEWANQMFIRYLFDSQVAKENRFGDVIMKTKRSTTDGKKLGFCLIGDPALGLSQPEYRVKITHVNEKQIDGSVVQFKAFDRVILAGAVVDGSGEMIDDFSGELVIRIFDGKTRLETIGNNYGKKFSYDDYVNYVYKGNVYIVDGKFSVSFIVPKDISYSTANRGKMSLYAYDRTTGREAQGYYNEFVVGGTANGQEKDTVPPEIRGLFLNDTTFADGDIVNTTPYFYARLWDKSGINITGNSPGHGITLYIDEDPNRNYNLNEYYENVAGSEGEGVVMFGIPELEPGWHFAEFKVWDIMNNARTATFTFEVKKGLKPFLSELDATPNPARGQVRFSFSHNRPECRMKVGIMVYDLAGRLLWKHEEQGTSGMFQNYTIDWDCCASGGARLHSGVYLYRAAISTDNSKEATDAKKLIILSQ